MLEFIDISKTFGEKKVLENFSIKINNQCLGILGPNGAGKSTILKLSSTLLYPDSGKILFNGNPIYDDVKEWKKKIGLVPEYPELFNNLTIYEHLLISSTIYGIEGKKDLINQYLEYFQLLQYKDTICSDCSQGMKKKLSIILAVIHDPEILILDEPFNGLDMYGISCLKKTILEYSKNGKTVIITTHLLDLVEKVVDSVTMINGGELIFNSPLELLLQKYSTLEDCYFDQIQCPALPLAK